MDTITDFILDYIQREYELPSESNIMAFNYVDSGYIDSLGLVQFFATLEDEFNISFTDDELTNPDIKIIGNLAKLVYSKVNSGQGKL